MEFSTEKVLTANAPTIERYWTQDSPSHSTQRNFQKLTIRYAANFVFWCNGVFWNLQLQAIRKTESKFVRLLNHIMPSELTAVYKIRNVNASYAKDLSGFAIAQLRSTLNSTITFNNMSMSLIL
ncbi:hypothetical protein Tcan_00175 [Toxocara canis]|uniref:Uncharacterized protein n=1 Tax=Toxocara canis TaxID=6265 RepID=A0A0B2VGF3_TOXCA|nr:hypothetical protein Tcan_00175 [Toxocara canis]